MANCKCVKGFNVRQLIDHARLYKNVHIKMLDKPLANLKYTIRA